MPDATLIQRGLGGAGLRIGRSRVRRIAAAFGLGVGSVAGALAMAFAFAFAFPPPALAVDGFNLPGSDYTSFDASAPLQCSNSCGGDSRCEAWTWVKPGIQGPTGRCWLKSRLPRLVKDACCNSGSRQNLASQRDLRAEDRTDRPGADYANREMTSWQSCESACAAEQRCSAWTYARPGLQGPGGRCWLKGKVPAPFDNAQTVSGVKFKPVSVPFD